MPKPVGNTIANANGLYDMYGNVWEWCHDRKSSSFPAQTTDPAGTFGSEAPTRRWFHDQSFSQFSIIICPINF